MIIQLIVVCAPWSPGGSIEQRCIIRNDRVRCTNVYFFAAHKEHMHVSILMLSVMSRAPFVFRIRCVMGFVYRNIDASFVSPSTMLCIV